MQGIVALYRRIWRFVAGAPLIVAIPFAAELLQHVVEITVGFYGDGPVTPQMRRVRLAFGLVKLAGLVLTILVALRWWGFGGALRRALRPSSGLGKGFAAFVAAIVLGDTAEDLLRDGAGALLGLDPAGPFRLALWLAPTIVMSFAANLWMPWVVALLVEDPAIGFRRSFRLSFGRLWRMFATMAAGVLPLMALHYVLAEAAIGRSAWIVWPLNLLDAVLVPFLAVAIASSYFAVYLMARARGEMARTPEDRTAEAPR